MTIRIWNGPVVAGVFTVSGTGTSSPGIVGGAENSCKVDIELDPWRGLIVDHTAEHPIPVAIRGD